MPSRRLLFERKKGLTSCQERPASEDRKTLVFFCTVEFMFPVAKTRPMADALDRMGTMRYIGYSCWNFCVRCREQLCLH